MKIGCSISCGLMKSQHTEQFLEWQAWVGLWGNPLENQERKSWEVALFKKILEQSDTIEWG